VLRLWAGDLELTNGQTVPLWIGSVVEERPYHPLGLVTLVSAQSNVDAPRKALAGALPGGRLVSRAKAVTAPDWDGQVLLARQDEIRK
jgi:undecaprenyl-diphosphatase